MSHIPPNGPPPPYYGYAAPPHAPGAYTYMPTPVMMPVPFYPPQPQPQPPAPIPDTSHGQPTYVTNYIYQQPAPPNEPVRVADDFIDWVPATTSTSFSLAHRAVIGGKEGWDSSPLWVIRAHHSGDFVPGKLSIKNRSAYVPHGGKEVPVHNFEVLCAPAHVIRWLPSSNGQVPVGAIPAGNTHTAEPLYIGRARHLRSVTPGKVHPSHGCCYISYGGNEVPHKQYEVLCKVVG